MAERGTRVAAAEITVRDRTRAGVSSAVDNFEALHAVVRDNWWGIQNLGTSFAGVGAIISGGMAVAAKAAVDFETGMAGVARTTREQGESAADAIRNTQGLADELRNIARQSPVSIDRLAGIAQEAGALGVARKDIAAFTQTIVQLVATTNLTDESAAQLARVASVMRISADQTGNLGSAILYAGRNTAATEKEIVRFAQYLAPVAVQARASTGELIAMSAILPSLGQRADTARTTLSKVVSLMGKAFRTNSKEAQVWAQVAGTSVEKLSAEFDQNGFAAITRFVEGMARLGPESKAVASSLDALGVREGRQQNVLIALAAAYGKGGDAALQMRNAMKQVNSAYIENTELTEAYKTVTGTAGAQISTFKNTVHDLAIDFGEALLPALKLAVEALQFLAQGFGGIPGPFKTVIAITLVATAAMAALGAALLLIGPKMILIKGAMREAAAAVHAYSVSSANAAAIVATANNTTTASTLKATFALARKSQAERDAAFAAFQQANAQKVANAIHGEAILLNNALTRSVALQAEVTRLATLAQNENRLAQQLTFESDVALANNKRAVARNLLAQAEAHRANAVAATADLNATRALAAETAREIATRQAAIAATIKDTEVKLANAAAASRAATATALMARSSALLKRALGPIIAILLILGTLWGSASSAQEDASASAAENARYQSGVARALDEQKKGVKNAVQSFILLQLSHVNGMEVANRYKITLAQLYATIAGTNSPAQAAEVMNKLAQANKNGDTAAADLYNKVLQLNDSFSGQGLSALGAADGTDAATSAMDDNTAAAQRDKDALDKLRESNENINQALLALPEALLAQRSASLAVKDATDEYAEALENLRNQAERVRMAELELQQARLEQEQASDEIVQAEIDLARARQEAADKVADAEDKLADANDKVLSANEKVLEAEQALEKLRSGPTIEELQRATIKLADANLKLRDSQFKVRDAQYMLNYLQAEGASARDLEEAQYQLDAANQQVAESTLAVSDAQSELNDISTVTPEEMAEAERELEKARRDAAAAVRDQQDAEEDLADARREQANDTLYEEALQRLVEAQQRLLEATQDVEEAQANLADQKNNITATQDLAKAQLALEEALYRQAEANVEVQKQLALSRGEAFGTGREARALAAELDKLGLSASGPISADFRKFSKILRQARKDIGEADEGLSDFGSGFDTSGITTGLGDLSSTFPNIAKEASKGFVDRMVTYFKENGAIAIATGLIAMMVAAILIFVFGVPALAALAIGALVFALVYYIKEHADDIKDAFHTALEWVKDLPDWFKDRFDDIKDLVKEHWLDFFLYIVGGIPGAILKFLWDKLNLTNIIKGIFNRDRQSSSDSSKAEGKSLGTKLWEGFLTFLNTFFNPLNIIRAIFNRQRESSAADGKSFGDRLGDALQTGLLLALGGLGGALGKVIRGALNLLPGWVKGPINSVIGIYNGFVEAIASKGFHIDAVKALGQTIFPEIDINFGFMRGLKINPLKLAEGGIATSATLGIFGEAGPEAVLPLDELYRLLSPLSVIAEQLLAANDIPGVPGRNASPGGDTFNIYANDADALEIAEEVIWKKMVRV